MDLAEKLLVLAASADADGGQGLLRALRGILGETAPFDAGEAVLRVEGALVRWRLDEREGELLGDDMLRHVTGLRAPLRLDDLHELVSFPETQRRLEAAGMRSLLVLPLHGGEEHGVVALARRYGWAFVGASLHALWPVAGMAGIALRHSVLLTDLRGREEELESEVMRATATPDELRARLEQAIAYGDEREGLRSAANAGWEATRAELKETARRLAAAEAAAQDATRGREEAETRGAAAEALRAAEAASREAGEAEAHRRQAEADERVGRAEGQRQALTLEREALRGELDASRAALEEVERDRAALRSALAEREEDARRAREEAQAEAGRGRAGAEEAARAADSARAEANQARAEAEQALADATRARGEAAEARAEADQKRRETQQAANEIAQQRRAADELRQELEQAVAALESRRSPPEHASALREAQAERETLRAERDTLRGEGDTLRAERETLRAANQTVRLECERLRASLTAERAAWDSERATLARELEKARRAAAAPARPAPRSPRPPARSPRSPSSVARLSRRGKPPRGRRRSS